MDTQLIIMADKHPNTSLLPCASFQSHDTPVGTPYESCFEVSDFLEFSDWVEDSSIPAACYPNYAPSEVVANSSGNSSGSSSSSISSSLKGGAINRNSESGREKNEIRKKVAFKTKSEIEVLDDGFKWRKYGKKMVKNSPNPRNYYRCSIEGCPVKKRVERDNEDPRFVVTTYEGIHNHL